MAPQQTGGTEGQECRGCSGAGGGAPGAEDGGSAVPRARGREGPPGEGPRGEGVVAGTPHPGRTRLPAGWGAMPQGPESGHAHSAGALRYRARAQSWSSAALAARSVRALLQGIFLTQESNWGLLHCSKTLYRLSYEGSQKTTKPMPRPGSRAARGKSVSRWSSGYARSGRDRPGLPGQHRGLPGPQTQM